MAKKKSRPKPQIIPGGSKTENVNSQVLSALNAAIAPVPLLKVCRLCEAKDGPFLNIFGVEQPIAQKIADLMPFNVSEYDDLPHKICFRCSAKVEELHDFVQKCVRTQENLRNTLGKKGILPTKSKTRKIWEEKLNQSNMSNDEICDAVIKQAMKGIIDIPPSPPREEEPPPPPPPTIRKKTSVINVDMSASSSRSHSPMVTEQKPTELEKPSTYTKRKRSSMLVKMPEELSESIVESEVDENTEKRETRSSKAESHKSIKLTDIGKLMDSHNNVVPLSDDDSSSEETILPELVKAKPVPPPEVIVDTKPFNIHDYICKIKVNGVGTLHQCKLCNRNFLSEEFIMSHGCAKNGVPKKDIITSNLRPSVEPNKNPMSNVKYIYNKPSDVKPVEKPVEPVKAVEPSKPAKPKIGPASRVKKAEPAHSPELIGMKVEKKKESPPSPPPTANPPQFLPTIDIPGMNSRYRLVQGPNNTFTLIEDSPREPNQPKPAPVKRKPSDEEPCEPEVAIKKKRDKGKGKKSVIVPEILSNIIDLDEDPPEVITPYPVGIFQAANPQAQLAVPLPRPPVTFTTPAMKKQSYQVVQTGNPSKLLISAKPQPPPVEAPRPHKSKKKSRDQKILPTQEKQPFSVTLEDATRKDKDQSFFTFVNVDPLLQPSYVLPTDNIIQESQISTSSAVTAAPPNPNKPYSCNLCTETFSREKKLLVHIQAHYNKMDEEDNSRFEKPRRTRRS